jgi:hypothetical protein
MKKSEILIVKLLLVAVVVGTIGCAEKGVPTPTPTPIYTTTPTTSPIPTPTPTPSLTPTITPTPIPSPIISFTPYSVSFTATIGGNNPPNETITIWNSGGGNVSWYVNTDATWLELTPTSGSSTDEESAVYLQVNISDLSVGNYSSVITILAPKASKTSQTIPVSLTLTEAPVPKLNCTPSMVPIPTSLARQMPTGYTEIKFTVNPCQEDYVYIHATQGNTIKVLWVGEELTYAWYETPDGTPMQGNTVIQRPWEYTAQSDIPTILESLGSNYSVSIDSTGYYKFCYYLKLLPGKAADIDMVYIVNP